MKNIISFILINLISSITLFSQNVIPKQGGICFRVDDNHSLSKFHQYADVFDKYNQKFTFALNLAEPDFEDDTYINGIKQIQGNGHEIMDHTPNHRTNYFITKFNANGYRDSTGVDHIINTKICLTHESPNIQLAEQSGIASINNNVIEFSKSDYDDIEKDEYIYIHSRSKYFSVG